MKILIITPRVPFPIKDGGAIAMYNMCKGLADNGVELDLFSYNTTKHYVLNPSEIEELSFFRNIFTSDINNDLNPIDAFFNLLKKESYNTSRFIKSSFEKDLIKCLKENVYDIVQCEVLFGGLYVDTIRLFAPQSKIVYRAHNVEFKIWERLAAESSGLKKIYLKLMSKRLRKEEISLIKKFDLIVPITDVDKEWFLLQGVQQVFVSPTGINYFDEFTEVKTNKIGFLGSLDWQPNIGGVAWFIDNVWPLVINEISDAVFEIAGRNCPENFSKYNDIKGVKVIGEVDSAVDFIKSNRVMVVPLLSGSGMRIKVVEELALSVPIVSTTVGCEGISIKDGEEVLLSDDADDFAKKIIALCTNYSLRENVAKQGYAFVQRNYSNKVLVKALTKHYEKN